MPDRPNPLKDQLPKSAQKVGKPQPKGGGQGVQVKGDTGSPCLVSFPRAGVPLVGSVGGGCLLSKTNVRAVVGGLLIGAGAVVVLGGAAVLAVAGFRKTPAAHFIAGAAEAVPGGAALGAVISGGGARSVGRSVGRGVSSSRRAGAAEDARAERQLGEPRENASLRTGRGAVRETPAGTRRRKAETGATSRPAPRDETGF